MNSTSGVLDLVGFPDDGYYFYQSRWTDEPMIHLFPHWNWEGHEGRFIPVLAYTNVDAVELAAEMQREGLDYRQASIRIAESETLQRFCRLLKKPTIDFTLLNKAFGAIQPETWERVNHVLALDAVAEETISLKHVRTDTTVTECNIHWPTDSSLLWDVYRVAAREMAAGRALPPPSRPAQPAAGRLSSFAGDP